MADETFDLMGLPMELICQVSTYLPTEDLGNLRQTCRELEKILFDSFAAEYFSIRQVFIHPISLVNLCDISKHPQFSQVVKKVIFCNDKISLGNGPIPNQQDLCLEQKYCFESGEYRQLLESALKNLPNCRTFEQRDFVSNKQRSRDGTPWRSYGVKHLERKGGGRFRIHPRQNVMYGYNGQQHQMVPNSALMNAIVYASKANLRLESLMIINQHPSWHWGDFLIPTYADELFRAAFASIKTLMISVDHRNGPSDIISRFGAFLDILPQLEHLRANLDNHHHSPNDEHVKLLEIIGKKPLRSLELGKVALRDNDLLTLLHDQSDTLETLTFFRVAIFTVGDAVSRVMPVDPTPWHLVVSQMQLMKKLRSVTFNDIGGPLMKSVYRLVPNAGELISIGLMRSWTVADDSKDKMGQQFEELLPQLRYDPQDEDEDEDDSEDDESDMYDSDDPMGMFLDELDEDEEDEDDMDDMDLAVGGF